MAESCRITDGKNKRRSASHIARLTDDLLIEILCRVGCLKQVSQCWCVSKQWRSLINTYSSHSNFSRNWRRISRPQHDSDQDFALLTQYQDRADERLRNYHAMNFTSEEPTMLKPESFFPRTNNTKIDPVHILASHKDLVLCCPSKNDHSVYYLCNPFSGQWRELPRPPPLPVNGSDHRIRIGLTVFEHNDGCDFKFKVVRVIPHPRGQKNKVKYELLSGPDIELQRDHMKVEMFSSGRRGWREMIAPEFECSYISRGVPYQGMLVWAVQSSLGQIQLIGSDFFPRDDVDASYAEWSSLPLPPGYGPGSAMGVRRGCLRIAHVVHSNFNRPRILLTWQFGQNKEWEVVQVLDFSEGWDWDGSCIRVVRSCNKGDVSVLDFHPHYEDILYLFCALPTTLIKDKNMSSCIFSCNVKARTLTLIRWLPVRTSCDAFPLLMPFCPALFPLSLGFVETS